MNIGGYCESRHTGTDGVADLAWSGDVPLDVLRKLEAERVELEIEREKLRAQTVQSLDDLRPRYEAPVRARSSRRVAQRRASGVRSGTDPGGEESDESPPARRALQLRRGYARWAEAKIRELEALARPAQLDLGQVAA